MRILAAVLLLSSVLVRAQSRPEDGGHEVGLWIQGGHGTTGRTASTGVLNAGLRYGWVLTSPIGPGPLKGRFEYAVDAVPLWLLFQRNTVLGTGLDPVVLKWNFATRGRLDPYFEITGGTLFTSDQVPPGASQVNFTSGAALGMHFLRQGFSPTLALRYLHISNSGLSEPNPGINSVQFMLGLSRFSKNK